MTPRIEAALRRLAAAALLAAAAGCGPGVGGTGTGLVEDAFVLYGARPQPLCSAEFAAQLQCSGAPSSASYAAGTAPLLLADTSPARVLARLAGNGIELQAVCDRMVFFGRWGDAPALGARFIGLAGDPAAAPAPASMTVQTGSGGTLVLTLFDLQGRTLWGPRTLQAAAAEPPPAACG